MANILIIDDDRAICKALVGVVSRIGYDAAYAVPLKEGLVKQADGGTCSES